MPNYKLTAIYAENKQLYNMYNPKKLKKNTKLITEFPILDLKPQENNTVIILKYQGVAEILSETDNLCCLNHSSGTRPGGGYSSGAIAQEEEIMRCSALYACLYDLDKNQIEPKLVDFYSKLAPYYTNFCIYSPDVPVFRNQYYDKISEKYHSFITAAAINFKHNKTTSLVEHVDRSVMVDKIRNVLITATMFGHKNLLLGPWGCGAFTFDKNFEDYTRYVAETFKNQLKLFNFDTVIFALPIFTEKSSKNADIFRSVFSL